MSDYLNEENKKLKEKITLLESEVKKLKDINQTLSNTLDKRNEYEAERILEDFHSSKNIRRTASKYDMEMEDLFDCIVRWDGCRDGLQRAHDYDDCRLEYYGRRQHDEEQECDEMDPEELENRMRTPEPDEIISIICDYKKNNLTLYELADNYNLKINNLFRLLKEYKLIEKESDATDYGSFYIEYVGKGTAKIWDSKSELGLIESFYKS
jgi:hypothetical protein